MEVYLWCGYCVSLVMIKDMNDFFLVCGVFEGIVVVLVVENFMVVEMD